ncbi:MAG: class I SAM-dependent methyltransferase, partial [Haloferacaceae archaeon]
MSVPTTVETALADVPVAGAVCLEAGAGRGNATRGLLAAGAERVYAVTNDREHARDLRRQHLPRTRVLRADLRAIPLPADSVEVVTAHALCNLLSPEALATVAAELTRVAAPGCHLVVDDYAPLPPDAAMRDLFAVVNAASELVDGRPGTTFYPAESLRDCFAARGWAFERERTLLEPVPWTRSHLDAHAALVRAAAARLEPDIGAPLVAEAERLVESIGREDVGEMYSLAFRLSRRGDVTDRDDEGARDGVD